MGLRCRIIRSTDSSSCSLRSLEKADNGGDNPGVELPSCSISYRGDAGFARDEVPQRGSSVPWGRGDHGAAWKKLGEAEKGHLRDAGGVSSAPQRCCRRRGCSGREMESSSAGVSSRWLTQNVQVQPQNSSLVSGVGGSGRCRSFLGLAFWFTHAPSLCKFLFPVKSPCEMPMPHMKWRR